MSAAAALLIAPAAEPVRRADVPALAPEAFCAGVAEAVAGGGRLAALWAEAAPGTAWRLGAAVTRAADASVAWAATQVRDRYPALTPDCPAAHLFEREIWEQTGIEPVGHPWLKPVRFHGRPGAARPLPATGPFFRVEGAEVHEVAVGPVHAGIIEPGHFRFQCRGEDVLHLEIALGFQHRGVEAALERGPAARAPHYAETLAGDTSVGHALAWAQAREALAGARVPPRGHALRGVALELERLANHAGDLGALAQDVGFLPTSAYGGRLRGDFLNMTAAICGSRFGRGLVRPGGVAFDLDDARRDDLRRRLDEAMAGMESAAELLWDTPSVLARFEDTGCVAPDDARALGLVGPAARACGLEVDVRTDFPTGIYCFARIPVTTHPDGDVFARAYVRWLEMRRSAVFIREQLDALPAGPVRAACGAPAADRLCLSLVEGWRGEIVHVASLEAGGGTARWKVVDPSFRNWRGLALALRGQAISDFPLCNKSFNLSYCGHDL